MILFRQDRQQQRERVRPGQHRAEADLRGGRGGGSGAKGETSIFVLTTLCS
jgi:hypothetical protein